jgi:Na+/H+ antiporter NhaB
MYEMLFGTWHGGNEILDIISDLCVAIVLVCVIVIITMLFYAIYKYTDLWESEYHKELVREEKYLRKKEKEERKRRRRFRRKSIKLHIQYFLQKKKW